VKTAPTDTRRLRDLAALLPVIGLFLIMPPFVTLFAVRTELVAGVPLIVVYLFGVWLALVVAAAWLARRLSAESAQESPAGDGDWRE
jgi:hypothetical protein